MDTSVGDGATDGGGAGGGGWAVPVGDVDGGFGGAVEVVEGGGELMGVEAVG